jgi:hypothetical protein
MYNVVIPVDLTYYFRNLEGFEIRLGQELLKRNNSRELKPKEGFQKYMLDERNVIVESIGMLGSDWRIWNSYDDYDEAFIYEGNKLISKIDLNGESDKGKSVLLTIYNILVEKERAAVK